MAAVGHRLHSTALGRRALTHELRSGRGGTVFFRTVDRALRCKRLPTMRNALLTLLIARRPALAQKSIFPTKSEKDAAKAARARSARNENKAFLKGKMKNHIKDMKDLSIAAADREAQGSRAAGPGHRQRAAPRSQHGRGLEAAHAVLRPPGRAQEEGADAGRRWQGQRHETPASPATRDLISTCVMCHATFQGADRRAAEEVTAPAVEHRARLSAPCFAGTYSATALVASARTRSAPSRGRPSASSAEPHVAWSVAIECFSPFWASARRSPNAFRQRSLGPLGTPARPTARRWKRHALATRLLPCSNRAKAPRRPPPSPRATHTFTGDTTLVSSRRSAAKIA